MMNGSAGPLDKARIGIQFALKIAVSEPADVETLEAVSQALVEALRELSSLQDLMTPVPQQTEPQELILNLGGVH